MSSNLSCNNASWKTIEGLFEVLEAGLLWLYGRMTCAVVGLGAVQKNGMTQRLQALARPASARRLRRPYHGKYIGCN